MGWRGARLSFDRRSTLDHMAVAAGRLHACRRRARARTARSRKRRPKPGAFRAGFGIEEGAGGAVTPVRLLLPAVARNRGEVSSISVSNMRVVSSRSFQSAPLFPVCPEARSTRRSLARGGSRIGELPDSRAPRRRDIRARACSRVVPFARLPLSATGSVRGPFRHMRDDCFARLSGDGSTAAAR